MGAGAYVHIRWVESLSGLTRALLLAGAALLMLLATSFDMGRFYIGNGSQAARAIISTQQVIETLSRVRFALGDGEIGLHRYVLTGDGANLQAATAAAERARQQLPDLSALAADGMPNAADFGGLVRAVQAALGDMDGIVQLGLTQDRDAAAAAMRGGADARLADDADARIAQLLGVEEDLLKDRQGTARHIRERIGWVTWLIAGVAALIAGLAFTLLLKETGRRRRAAVEASHLRELTEFQIEELQASYRMLAAAHEAVGRANLAKQRFLETAGHDLQQPLQVVAMAIEMLERACGPAGARHASRALFAVRMLDHAFGQFIDAARLAGSATMPRWTTVDLDRELDGICDQLDVLASAKGLRLRRTAARAAIVTDPDLLKTILANLIGNAIKYTDKGGVLVGVRRRGGALLIEVRDTGRGIPADRQAMIFEEFCQLEPGDSDGVGLGLCIVARAAALLGYRVSVRSSVGRGSCFTVELPAAG